MEQLRAYNLGETQMERRVDSSALTVLRTATVVEEYTCLIWTLNTCSYIIFQTMDI